MYDTQHRSRIKNDKIQRWRLELSQYNYDVVYRPGKDNHAADALSRAFCGSTFERVDLRHLHESLCHPGVARLMHFVRAKNLPFSLEDVKRVTNTCPICCEVKPQFFKPLQPHLIKATQPFERLSIDFKGPLPSVTKNRFILTIIDEFSRFPFAFPCADMTTQTIIDCLCQLFAIFGMPSFIHSDRGSSFMSSDLRSFLHNKGIATSRTTSFNPQGNGQVERLNHTLWRTILLTLKTRKLPTTHWEYVLLDALHSIRSLLCTATNATPHERMFAYNRRSPSGTSLPTWLTSPGPVLLRKHARSSKYDPLVEKVELLECNPQFAHIRLPNGREETVSLRHLAPIGCDNDQSPESNAPETPPETTSQSPPPCSPSDTQQTPNHSVNDNLVEQLIAKQQRVHPYNLRSGDV